MAHDRYLKDSIIYNRAGEILHVGVEEGNNKYYAVIVQCGHVGRGYFIPICFGICAKDMESAIEIAKSTARVKRDAKYCILGAAEITHPEFLLIEYANDHDQYLRTDYVDHTFEEIESRRIMAEELVQDVVAEDENSYRAERMGKTPLVSKIKTADKYEDYQILQRYFAPMQYGKQYIFPRKVNMDELLAAYYQELAVKYGILKKKPSPLAFYYQIFGKENALGLSYDEQEGCLVYTSLKGKNVYVPLSSSSRAHVEEKVKEESLVAKKQDALEEVEYVSTGSAIEKFNRRMAKHKELSKKAQKQPGSDE